MQDLAWRQYMLELMNRARLDPRAEAERLGLDAKDLGLPSGSLSVLAGSHTLDLAAEEHSDWMLATDTFSHSGDGDSSAGERMEEAGHIFATGDTWSENIALYGSNGTLDVSRATAKMHANLFESDGHRLNMLSDRVSQVGVAVVQGDYLGYDTAVTTQNFASSGGTAFLTGVAYQDRDGDGFYSIGEGMGGVRFRVGGSETASQSAGGYSMALAGTGMTEIGIEAGGKSYGVKLRAGGESVKLDLVGGDMLRSTATLDLFGGGLRGAELLGREDANLWGNARGNDLYGNAASNRLFGRDGYDLIDGGAGADTLRGGSGNDTVYGGHGRDLVGLGTGDDLFIDNDQGGANGQDTVFGWDGNDEIRGGAGADRLFGHRGDDKVSGGIGADRLFGGAGADRIWGGGDADKIRGGSQDDTIEAGWGDDTVDGGLGADTVRLGRGADLYEDNTQDGAFGRDLVFGNEGNDTILGGGGDDTFRGNQDNDVILGGDGDDLVDGGTGADRLFGNVGRDRMIGGDGDDTLAGGIGNDTMTGGAGADVFLFRPGEGADRITDFTSGEDVLRLEIKPDFAVFYTERAAGLEIAWETGKVLLEGLSLDDLHSDDIILA